MGLIEIISPKWAYKRQAWRNAMQINRRNYDAGQYDRRNRNWYAMNDSAEYTDRDYRSTVRARSRDLERNSDLMNAQIHPWLRNVAGKGYKLQARTENEELNRRIEALWKKWCKKDNCDITGTQSFWEMMRMAIRRKRIDGGILFIKCYTYGGLTPFKLQALEVDELDDSRIQPYTAGNKVVGGIEYNKYHYAVGYWFRQYNIEGYQTMESRYVERKNVIFYFTKSRPSQLREMPEMAATISRIKDVTGYMEAMSVKERIAACLSVFIKKAVSSAGIGRGTMPSEKRSTYDDLELEPGLISELNAGDEIQVVNPGATASNGADFVKTNTRIMSAGQGISYEAASRDLSGVTYAAARQTSLEDENAFAAEINKLTDDILSEVYETFVISLYLSGLISAPDFWKNKDDYLAHEWIQPPKKWIDPQKEANADKIALQTGQKTLIDVWSEDGNDYQEVLDDIKKVCDYANEIGLKLDIPFVKGGEEIGR